MLVTLPTALSPPAFLVALWVAAASGHVLAGELPGALAAAAVAGSYALWLARGRRWHDAPVILALLPAVLAGAWIAIGGLVLGLGESDARRLALEVAPGVALTGLATAVISYHGRHRPPPARADGRG